MAPNSSFLPHRPRTGPTPRPTGRRSLRWIGAAVLAVAFVVPTAGAATTSNDPISQAQQQRDDIRRQRADLASQIDLVKASDNEVAAALNALDQNVRAQEAKVADARKAIEDAEHRLDDLKSQLDQNQADVARIELDLRKQAIQRYVNPEGSFDSAQMLKSSNFDQAEQRKALADTVSGNHTDAVDLLKGAKAKIADLQQETDAARAEADARRQDEQTQLDALQTSRNEQAKVKAEWDKRLNGLQDDDAKLGNADAELAALIQQKQAEQAAAAEAARQAQLAAQQQAAAQAQAQAQAQARAQASQASQATNAPGSSAAPGSTGGANSTSTAGNSPTTAKGTAPAPSAGGGKPVSGGRMIWPINGTVSQEFGHNGHPGIDIFAPMGTPIYAALGGTVIYAQFNSGGYGNLVVVDHGNGLATAYAHQSQILVSVGQTVGQGQQLGLEGSTGNSTGPHLHFEVRVDGSVRNPRNYLP